MLFALYLQFVVIWHTMMRAVYTILNIQRMTVLAVTFRQLQVHALLHVVAHMQNINVVYYYRWKLCGFNSQPHKING